MKTFLYLLSFILISLLLYNCSSHRKYRSSVRTRSGSIKTRRSTDKETPEIRVSLEPISVSSGVLTAGEINDFSKWQLWQDIAEGDLKIWQETWQIKPLQRYTLQVTTDEGRAVIDGLVQLKSSDGKTLWTSRTDNTGKAEIWINVFADKRRDKPYSLQLSYLGKSYSLEGIAAFHKRINLIKIPVSCSVPEEVDVMFVVDATGSMSDEIFYLQKELNDIITKVKETYPVNLRLGSVFYRDHGDEYLTKKSELSNDQNQCIKFINEQDANGGGDFPEALDKALEVAVNKMQWSETARARLLFLILDAPPHENKEVRESLQKSILAASAKGIRIIPITASGIDKGTEYLMRTMALTTNGTYVFLTDHSGVGNAHIEPTTDEYDVELLNDLLLRLFKQYLSVPACEEQISFDEMQDTMVVVNPNIIDHVILDSNLLAKVKEKLGLNKTSDHLELSDSLSLTDSQVDSPDANDASIKDEEDFNLDFDNFKYYPNPTNGVLFIEINGEIKELFLADTNGKLIERYTPKASSSLEINLSNYPSGIYYLTGFSKEKRFSGKVVVVH